MASTSVDLPLPFSPAKNVTRESSFTSSSCRIAGMENGYASKLSTSSRFRTSARTKRSSTRRGLFVIQPQDWQQCSNRAMGLALYGGTQRSEEHTSELQSPDHIVCRLLLEKKKRNATSRNSRFKSLDTLKVKIISVTFRRLIRTNHNKASYIGRHVNIQMGGCTYRRLFPCE